MKFTNKYYYYYDYYYDISYWNLFIFIQYKYLYKKILNYKINNLFPKENI